MKFELIYQDNNEAHYELNNIKLINRQTKIGIRTFHKIGIIINNSYEYLITISIVDITKRGSDKIYIKVENRDDDIISEITVNSTSAANKHYKETIIKLIKNEI